MKRYLISLMLLVMIALGAGCSSRPAGPVSTATATRTTRLPTATHHPTATPSEPAAVQWLAHAVEIENWTGFDASWENEHILVEDQFKQVVVAPNTETEQRSVQQSLEQLSFADVELTFSPEGTYAFAGDDTHYMLLHVSDGALLGDFISPQLIRRGMPVWASDETAVAVTVVNPDSRIVSALIWRPGEPQPQLVPFPEMTGDYNELSWSPDNQAVIIPTWRFIPDIWAYIIVYTDNRPPMISPINLGELDQLSFLTENILQWMDAGCYHGYVVAATGVPLDKIAWMGCGLPPTQGASLSPSQRWLMLDGTEYHSMRIDRPGPEYYYMLYDFQSDNSYDVFTSTNTALDFLGWSEDSSRFYVVWNPLLSDASATPREFKGLLALDLFTKRFRSLNPEITHAWLSSDSERFFSLTDTGNGEWLAGFYDTNGQALSSLFSIAVPTAPIEFRGHSLLPLWEIQPTWSSNGTQIAYRDASGSLWLARLDGTTQLLGTGLPVSNLDIAWSPDDTLIFVRSPYGEQSFQGAWVLLPPLRPGQEISLARIAMIDGTNGWGQTASGHLVRTADGGATWLDVTPLDNALFFFADAQNAWASRIGQSSPMDWETADGGATWDPSSTSIDPQDTALRSFPLADAPFFLDESTGWRVSESQLQKTADGGLTWTKVAAVGWPSAQLSFVDESHGWAAVSDGETFMLLRTTDGGRTWSLVQPVVTR